MRPLAVVADAERVVIDYLTPLLVSNGEDVTVGVSVPVAWIKGTKAHVQVALDGTSDVQYPLRETAALRVTTWHESTTTAKNLARLCMGLLLSHPGGGGVFNIRPATGVLPTRDPDTGAQLATIGVQVNLRYTAV